ncbi:GrpB family protein [Nocardia sp. NPDC059239]|uniref:GrpB family protein n=1 Tax=Nocardia sp. NPDC059239 TaxID=3346785 RepID=UPI0036CF7132
MPAFREITRHHEPDPSENPRVDGPPPPETITIVAYDPQWPRRFQVLAAGIGAALGDVVRDIEHVGSTSVEGLAAKDVIDIVLTIADSRRESVYVPPLETPSAISSQCENRRSMSIGAFDSPTLA